MEGIVSLDWLEKSSIYNLSYMVTTWAAELGYANKPFSDMISTGYGRRSACRRWLRFSPVES